MARAHLLVFTSRCIADTVVGNDVEIMANKSPRQPQLQVKAPSVAEGYSKQDTATSGAAANVQNVALSRSLPEKQLVDSPIANGFICMDNRPKAAPILQFVLS